MISKPIPAEDYARHLTPAELLEQVRILSAARQVVVGVAQVDALESHVAEHGHARAEALIREVALFLRRNLRGTDAIALDGSDILLLVDGPAAMTTPLTERLVGSVRSHHFASMPLRGQRVTVSMGVAVTAAGHLPVEAVLEAAREARATSGADSARVANTPRVTRLELTRFMGRGEQLAQLSHYLDDMVRGMSRVVAITCERGNGASTLARALGPEVRVRGASLVSGIARAHHVSSPYALWGEVLRGVRRLPVKSTRHWRELSTLDPSLERPAGEGLGGGSKMRLLEELADFLRLAAQQRPLLLHLDNLQQADDASWSALEYLVTQLESERIMFVLSMEQERGAELPERWVQIASRPRHHEIRLSHLTRDDVKRWLEAALRTSELGRDLLAHVYRQTEGNPLLVQQLLRDLQESGQLVLSDDVWRWTSVAKMPTQLTLAQLVARRLERLTEQERLVLETAAIFGRESSEEALLGSMTSELSNGVLESLVSRGWLSPTFEREHPSYVVSHDAISAAVSGQMPVERRMRAHQRAAEILSRSERHSSAEIASHYELSGDRERAHHFALLAADEAIALHESRAVAEILTTAARTAPTEEALAGVRVRMATLAEMAGQYEEAESLCDEALAYYSEHGDVVQALRVKRTRALVRMQRGQAASDTLEALFALEREAETEHADMERAAILLLISQTHWRLGDLRSAQRVAAECVEIAERGNDAILTADSCNRLAVTIQLEDPKRARDLFNRSLAIATAAGDAFRRVRCLNNIGVLELISNNWNEARRILESASEQARTAGLIEPWGRAELNLGVLAGRIGDHEGAGRALMEALRLTSMVQNSEEQLYATYNLAHLEREREHFREAADTYELVTELADRIGQVEVQAGAIAGYGLSRFIMGDTSAASAALLRATPMTERLVEWFQGRELFEALRIHLAMADGDADGAAELFRSALMAASPTDVYGAAWLTAEFGAELRSRLPAGVEAAVLEYASRPEVLGNPRMRERLAVLKVDSNSAIDRSG